MVTKMSIIIIERKGR